MKRNARPVVIPNPTRESKQLFIQGTNQRRGEVFAEAGDKFFAKVVDAQFEFHLQGDHASSVTLYQNARKVDAKREAQ